MTSNESARAAQNASDNLTHAAFLQFARQTLGGQVNLVTLKWSDVTGAPVAVVRSLASCGTAYGVITAEFRDDEADEPTLTLKAIYNDYSRAHDFASKALLSEV